MDKKICVICGKEFVTNQPTKVSCSRECGKERNRRRSKQYYYDHPRSRAASEKQMRECVCCGKMFMPGLRNRKYCSDACRGQLGIARSRRKGQQSKTMVEKALTETKGKSLQEQRRRINEIARKQGTSYEKLVAQVYAPRIEKKSASLWKK